MKKRILSTSFDISFSRECRFGTEEQIVNTTVSGNTLKLNELDKFIKIILKHTLSPFGPLLPAIPFGPLFPGDPGTPGGP